MGRRRALTGKEPAAGNFPFTSGSPRRNSRLTEGIAEWLQEGGVPAHPIDSAELKRLRKLATNMAKSEQLKPGPKAEARPRRDEVLIDVEDVAAGNETKLRWNDRSEWICESTWTGPRS